MGSHNASSLAKNQQWRNDLQMRPADQAPSAAREMFKDSAQDRYLTPVLSSTTICCDQMNCDRAKIEIMPEQYFREPAAPFIMSPEAMQLGNKDPSAPQPEPFAEAVCSFCGLNRGQLVTICCTGRNCDNSTKIDDIHMGPPQQKRAKTLFNNNNNNHQYRKY